MADNMGTLSVDVALNIDTSVSEDQLREVLKNLEQEAITIKLEIDTSNTEEKFTRLRGIIEELPGAIKNLTAEFQSGMVEINQAVDEVTQKITDLRDALNGAKKNGGEGSGFDFDKIDDSLNHMEKEVKEVGDELTKLNSDKTGLSDVRKDAEQTSKAMEKTADSTKALKQASTDTAKAVVANEKEKQAETDKTTAKIEKQTEAIQKRNWAQEALDKDYSTNGKKAAREQLDYNYTKYFDDSSMHGLSLTTQLKSCYAYLQSLVNALNAGVNDKYLKKYQTANVHWPEDVGASEYYAQPNNTIVQQWERINSEVRIYADLIDRVNASGINTKAVPDLTKHMEEIVRTQGALTTANFSADTEQAKAYSDQLQKLNSAFDDLLQRHTPKQGVDGGAISQMAEQSKETVANLQEEKNAENEVAQVATAASEAVVNAENQEQASIQQTIRAFRNKSHEALEALNATYGTSNQQMAWDQLKTTYQRVHELGGDQGEDSFWELTGTQEGTAAAYAYLKAFSEVIHQGMNPDYFAVPDLSAGLHDRLPRSQISSNISESWEEAERLAEVYEQRLEEITSLSAELGAYLQSHSLTPEMSETLLDLQEKQDDIRKLGSGTVYDLTYTPEEIKEVENHLRELIQLQSQIPETDLGTEQVSVQAEQTTEGVKQENEALQETAQQASASAEAVVNAENQKQEELEQTAQAYNRVSEAANEASNWAQDALAKDYNTDSIRAASAQYRGASTRLKNIVGEDDYFLYSPELYTKQGAQAAYDFLNGFAEAVKKNVPFETIQKYMPSEWLENATDIGSAQEFLTDYSKWGEALQEVTHILQDYSKYYQEVQDQTGKSSLSSKLQQDINDIVENRDTIRNILLDSNGGVLNTTQLQGQIELLDNSIKALQSDMGQVTSQGNNNFEQQITDGAQQASQSLESQQQQIESIAQASADAKQEAAQWAQTLLNDQSAKTYDDILESLKKVKEFYPDFENLCQSWDLTPFEALYSQEGATAGYNFTQAFLAAWNNGASPSLLAEYWPSGWQENFEKKLLEKANEREAKLSGENFTPVSISDLNLDVSAVKYSDLLGYFKDFVKRYEEIIQTYAKLNEYLQFLMEVNGTSLDQMSSTDLAKISDRITQIVGNVDRSYQKGKGGFGKEYSDVNRQAWGDIKQVVQDSVKGFEDVSQAVQELSQAEQAQGEAGTTANQQVQNSTEGVAEGYKAVTAAANEAAEAEKQASSLAAETLNKDYTASGKKQAGDNLKAAYERLEQIRSQQDENGRINGIPWDQTEEGAAAGYAWGEAWMEGLRKSIAESKLVNYVPDEMTMFTGSDVTSAIQNSQYLLSSGKYPEELKYQQEGFKAVLQDYAQLYSEVETELGEHSIPDLIKRDMESVARARDQLRDAQASLSFSEENGYDTDSEKEDIEYWQVALSNREEQLQRDLEQVKQSYQEMGAEATEVFSSAAEGFNQVIEAEEKMAATDLSSESAEIQQISEVSESAATSLKKVANAEEQIVAADTSSEATELQRIGEAAKTSEEPVEALKEELQDLSNTQVKSPVPTETVTETPQHREDTGLKRTEEDIKAVTDAFNTLTRTEEQWQTLNAKEPADWTDKEVKDIANLTVQRKAANETIAKATDLTSGEIAAQEKYGKRLAELEAKQKAQIDLEKKRSEAIEERSKIQEASDAKAVKQKAIEPPPAPEPPAQPKQQKDTSLKQKKKEIDEISEAYNNLAKYEKQYRELSAMNPADMNASQKKQWNSISVQYENAQKVIANLSKETQLTEKQTQAQDKYNKKKKELDQIEQRTIETNQIAADTLAERQKRQEEAAEAERAAAEAEEKAIQEQIERLQEHINKVYEDAEAEKARAQAAQEEADTERELLNAYARLEELEPQHQKNQAILDSGKSLNGTQSKNEKEYADLKAKIDEAKISTEALVAAQEHYNEVVSATTVSNAYQTLIKDLKTYNELANKESLGQNLTPRQQGQMSSLVAEMKQAKAIIDQYSGSVKGAEAAEQSWNKTKAQTIKSNTEAEKSLGEWLGTYDSLAEAQEKVNEAFGDSSKLTWTNGQQQANGTARWGDELNKVQYTIKQVEGGQYKVFQAIKSTQTATTTWAGLVDQLSKRFSSLVAYLGTFVSFYRILGAAKSGINTVTELNTQLTEMRKVSDESVESLKRYQDQTFAVAKEVGSTAAQIQSSTADYLRLGKTLEESAELAKNTSILMSVSEFDSIDQATESMIAMTAAFKDMSSMEIIDELNKIGNNFSISTSDLAMGMQTAASTLTVAGNSFEQSLALMTAGNAVIQDYSKTATGLRTISLRIMGTKAAMEELEDMGEDVSDYEVTTTAKMAEQIEALTQVNGKKGVNILTDNGNLRSTYDILLDIAEVWGQIREEDERTGQNRQQALLEQLAGKTRASIAASILDNPEILKEVYAQASDAAGSAEEELAKYMDSIEGHLAQFNNAWQEVWAKTLDSDIITFFIDIGTAIGEMTSQVGGLVPLVGGLGAALLSVSKNVGREKCYPLIWNMPTRIMFLSEG